MLGSIKSPVSPSFAAYRAELNHVGGNQLPDYQQGLIPHYLAQEIQELGYAARRDGDSITIQAVGGNTGAADPDEKQPLTLDYVIRPEAGEGRLNWPILTDDAKGLLSQTLNGQA